MNDIHNFYDRLIRPKEAAKILGISLTTLWRLEKSGKIPKSISISRGVKGWFLSVLLGWAREKP